MSAAVEDVIDVEKYLAPYDLGDVRNIEPISLGIENRNYFVSVEPPADAPNHSGEFVLTLLNQPPNAGSAYTKMMASLADYGLPVAAPLTNRSAQDLSLVDGQPVMLQPRLTGRHTVNPTHGQIQSLARFVARMHRVWASASTGVENEFSLPPYPRTLPWLQEQAAEIKAELSFAEQSLLASALAEIESLLSREDVRRLPAGLIHADLFRDNVLFNERGLTGVLDFHHASRGFWIYDLAVVANDWCTDTTGALNVDRTTLLLKAYSSIRPLTREELWFFSAFATYAALAFWLSRAVAVKRSRSEPGVRTKDPGEFRRILEHHQRRDLYLDPRLFER